MDEQRNTQDHHDPQTEQDTASGGPAEPPETENADGTPKENPSGG